MLIRKQVFLPIIIFLLLTACSRLTAVAPTSAALITPSLGDHFPQIINTPSDFTEALITGELTLTNGCLRVNKINGDSFLLVWQPGSSTDTENGPVRVIDSTNKVVASVGDRVEIGGGEVPTPTYLGLTEPWQKIVRVHIDLFQIT